MMQKTTGALSVALMSLTVAASQSCAARSDPVQVSFSYTGASAVRGHFDGVCAAWGVDFARAPTSIEVQSHGGTLHVVRTRVNVTVITPADPKSTWEADRQWTEDFEVPPGTLLIEWSRSGLAVAFPFQYGRNSQGTFNVHVVGSAMNTSAPDASRLSSAGFYWSAPGATEIPGTGGPVLSEASFPGWSRSVQLDGESRASGNVSFYLREAVLTHGRGVQRLEQFRTEQANVTTQAFSRKTIIYSEAFLDLTDAKWNLPLDSTLECGRTMGRVSGGFISDLATGNARTGTNRIDFTGKALTLEGAFVLDENPHGRQSPTGGEVSVESNAEGDIHAVGLDFNVVSAPPQTKTALKITLAAAVLALGLLVAKYAGSIVGVFYSRFGRVEALENPNRDAIFQAVRENPGLDLSGLRRITSFHLSTVAYHVQVLARVGLVGRVRYGHSVRVVPSDLKTGAGLARVAEQTDDRVAFVASSTGPTPVPVHIAVRSLMARFGLAQRTAYRVVERAVLRGVVRRTGRGKGATICRNA